MLDHSFRDAPCITACYLWTNLRRAKESHHLFLGFFRLTKTACPSLSAELRPLPRMVVAYGLLTENVLHCLGNTASLPGLLSAVDLIMMIEIDKFDHAAILFDGKDQNKGLFDMKPSYQLSSIDFLNSSKSENSMKSSSDSILISSFAYSSFTVQNASV
jgi:hypothetical protein